MKSFDDLKKYAISDILSASGKDKITRVAENHINNLIEVALIKGAQSRQDEVDELKKQLTLVLDAYYLTSYFESEICVNAEEALGIKDRLSDSWYLKNVKGESHES